MRSTAGGPLVAAIVCLAQTSSAFADCAIVATRTIQMSPDEGLEDNQLVVHRFSNGAVHFRANLDNNTDGDPRSYHPDNSGAKNTLCNGINLDVPAGWTGSNPLVAYYRDKLGTLKVRVNGIGAKKKGETVILTGKESCRAFIELYREAKEANWEVSDSVPKVRWIAIASYGENLPCIQKEDDPAPGFFVSQTDWQDYSKDVCDTARYVDASTIWNIVLPEASFWGGWNIRVGNLAYVMKGDAAPIATFVADSSKGRAGEGSTALRRHLASLGMTSEYPIDFFVLPGEPVSSFVSNEAIRSETEARAASIGFNAEECVAALKELED